MKKLFKSISNGFRAVFRYIEPLWLGNDGKMSLRYVLAIVVAIDFISNMHYAVRKLGEGRTFTDLSTILLIEAGVLSTLLALRLIQNINEFKAEAQNDPPPTSKGE